MTVQTTLMFRTRKYTFEKIKGSGGRDWGFKDKDFKVSTSNHTLKTGNTVLGSPIPKGVFTCTIVIPFDLLPGTLEGHDRNFEDTFRF